MASYDPCPVCGIPACNQRVLLETRLRRGEAAFHAAVQERWPIDPAAAFGTIPTPLRMHADPRFSGRGVTIALVDAGFYPHADLTSPDNRIRAWADASEDTVVERRFTRDESPRWPGRDAQAPGQWHGLMTSTAAAGNGAASHGLYRGMAPEAEVVLVQIAHATRGITGASIARALRWIGAQASALGIRVVSLSVGGEPLADLAASEVDGEVAALVARGIVVVAAAGNDGVRRLVPPATAPDAVTVGGLDDRNDFSHEARQVWHSSYGETAGRCPKPELVAPSLFVAAPILPGTPLAAEARVLFERVTDSRAAARIAECKLITPDYQHVEGTSFATPIVAGTVACMLEANPSVTPRRVRELLVAAAEPVPGASDERQGAGALDAGLAVAKALADHHSARADFAATPVVAEGRARFLLHDHDAMHVEVFGSWNDWSASSLAAARVEAGLWEAELPSASPGRHAYKFLIDGARWLVDPANPRRVVDGSGHWNSLLDL